MQPKTYQMTSVDRQGYPIDLGRPFVPLMEGGMGTEYQATDKTPDGRWVNFPTIWDGRELPMREAYARFMAAQKAGQRFPTFDTLPAAEAAAADRSAYIGKLRNMSGSPIVRALLGDSR